MLKPALLNTRIVASAMCVAVIAACATQSTQRDTQSARERAAAPAVANREYQLDGHLQCQGKVTHIDSVLGPIVDRLVTQRIPYGRVPGEWRDCSGNFLRLSSYLAAACPEHAEQLAAPAGIGAYRSRDQNAVSLRPKARSTRAIARWYHAQGRFTPIFYDDAPKPGNVPSDLRKYRHLIKPGAVLWFSRGRPRSGAGVNALFKDSATGINHMGTVVAVKRNERGEVVRYHLFHGHGKTGTPASVTKAHFWDWPETYLDGGAKSYPPLGYWKQRLVGIGSLVEPLARKD